MFDPFLLAQQVLDEAPYSKEAVLPLLTDDQVPLTDILAAAFRIRSRFFGKEVTLHILNNVQNGVCPEDCRYCAQSAGSSAAIEEYPMKPDNEILMEAERAYKNGACRYCMVFSGSGPEPDRIEHLCSLVREIKQRFSIEVCVSPGRIDYQQALRLRAAGLDRLNHNLNTSLQNYANICTTHTFTDRLETLRAARAADLAVCSGLIVGMGETAEDLVDIALTFRTLGVHSIPVNFLIPVSGQDIPGARPLTPEYCLRVLCMFRFLNPRTEIRMAAGRELHLRSLQVMGLFAANSLFLSGYLNVSGHPDVETLQMIRDAGFDIRSEIPLDELISSARESTGQVPLKTINDLRPCQTRES
jgi:biotin synthase